MGPTVSVDYRLTPRLWGVTCRPQSVSLGEVTRWFPDDSWEGPRGIRNSRVALIS